MDGSSIPIYMNSKLTSRRLAFLSILTALCLAIQLSPRPPNVEFTSLFTFLVGALEGAFFGAFFGAFVMFVNGFFSPYGFAGLNLPFQMVGMAIVGLIGSIYIRYLPKNSISKSLYFEVAILGALSALIFDLITNFGVGVSFILSGMKPEIAIISALASGSFFSLIHIVSNAAVLGLAFLPLMNSAKILLEGDGGWLRKEY